MADYQFKDEDYYCHKCEAGKELLDLDINFVGDNIETSILCNKCGHTRVVDSITTEQAEKDMLKDLEEYNNKI